MTKRFTTLAAIIAAAGIFVPATAFAKTFSGHVTSFSTTSISVLDKEVVTVGIDSQTAFTKLITRKPWQESTALTANALRVGAHVYVHVPDGKNGVASWIQIATDFRNEAFVSEAQVPAAPALSDNSEAAKHRAEARARRLAPNASESKRPGSPDTALHCDRIADRLEKAAGK